MFKYFLPFIFFASLVIAQDLKVSGFIYNEENNEPIPFVNIRIAGTSSGTSANTDGKFVLTLTENRSILIFSAVGFKKKEIQVNPKSRDEIKIGLKPESIQMMEIVVGVEEDPSYPIIREAIKRKEENRKGLASLEYDFYSKDIILSSGNVAMVSEKFNTGYYEPGKKEKVITHSVIITENEKKHALSFNQNILNKMFVDFSEDTLAILGNQVFLPLARNAFDYYDYRLKEKKRDGNYNDNFIEVIPRSSIQPLLKGIIVIEDSSYSIKSIALSNNDGLRFPFVNDLKIEFSQDLNRFHNYMLPTHLKVNSSLRLNFSGILGTNNLSMNQEAVFTDYKINPTIPDSIYKTYSVLKIDSSKLKNPKNINRYVLTNVLSKAQIDSLRPVPLTRDELNAYKELDSTKSIGTQIKFSGLLGNMATAAVNNENKNSGNGFLHYLSEVFSVVYLRDNKVDGLVLGGQYGQSFINNFLRADAAAGYSLQRKKMEWKISLKTNVNYGLLSSVDIDAHSEARDGQMLNPYPDLLNSANVLLGFKDYYNYYLSEGGSLGINSKFNGGGSVSVKYIYEEEKSLPSFKSQSIFNSNRIVTPNYPVTEGKDNRIALNVSLGKDPQSFQEKMYDGLAAQFDLSDPALGSNFKYQRVRIISQLALKTFYGQLFSAPYLALGIEGGGVFGNYGLQHVLTPNTALSVYSPFLSFKGITPYEYAGNKFLALHAEHNWRTILFQSAGINFLADNFVDLITGVSLLKMWNNTNYFAGSSSDKVYWEAYIGFGRILGIGRIDFSFNANKKFGVTIALATMF